MSMYIDTTSHALSAEQVRASRAQNPGPVRTAMFWPAHVISRMRVRHFQALALPSAEPSKCRDPMTTQAC